LKARPAKLHRAATNVDREDNHAPGSVVSVMKRVLTATQRLDNPIKALPHLTSMQFRRGNSREIDGKEIVDL
jgi:hypothetical protein